MYDRRTYKEPPKLGGTQYRKLPSCMRHYFWLLGHHSWSTSLRSGESGQLTKQQITNKCNTLALRTVQNLFIIEAQFLRILMQFNAFLCINYFFDVGRTPVCKKSSSLLGLCRFPRSCLGY
ncbi:hypothetical protein EYC80_005179 [Monilinia laxa]|uniref:Uncharacterized protein n=1 Tax=Monilinia laxa TaxID=61186 RepID=A0A5N6KJE5_MONLA|nr:hypothetical protein EYC80_005179 [Monilinia laxa]